MRKNLVGLVKAMTEEMSMDFEKACSVYRIMEMTEDLSFNFSAHFLYFRLVTDFCPSNLHISRYFLQNSNLRRLIFVVKLDDFTLFNTFI